MKKEVRKIAKGMALKEYNKVIDNKRNIIEEYYDKKENEIKEMAEKDFITSFLNKEKNENLKQLMCASLSNNFELDAASTNISNKIDEILEKKKENKENIEEEINNKIQKVSEKAKNNRVKKYINDEINIIFFP